MRKVAQVTLLAKELSVIMGISQVHARRLVNDQSLVTTDQRILYLLDDVADDSEEFNRIALGIVRAVLYRES